MNTYNIFGEDATFHHVGLVVHSLTKTDVTCSVTVDPLQQVGVAFVSLHGLSVELIEPVTDNSPVRQSLLKGCRLLHLCYEVNDVEVAIKNSMQHGFCCIARPKPAVAFENRLIAWVFSPVWGLYEFVQRQRGVDHDRTT
jgi:methylmalonyl-CoA/ethylmalonyl-CoA epimerase